jgi:shikimate kinase
MGCGKTTVGKQLAERQGWDFVDTDRLVEERLGMCTAEIFERSGEAAFRSAESAVLGSLAERSRVIVATGGGLCTLRKSRLIMQAAGHTVWLDLGFETIMLRLGEGVERPLWQTDDAIAMRMLFERRKVVYALADHRIAVENLNTEAISKRIQDHFR